MKQVGTNINWSSVSASFMLPFNFHGYFKLEFRFLLQNFGNQKPVIYPATVNCLFFFQSVLKFISQPLFSTSFVNLFFQTSFFNLFFQLLFFQPFFSTSSQLLFIQPVFSTYFFNLLKKTFINSYLKFTTILTIWWKFLQE